MFDTHLPHEQASWYNHNEIDLSGIPAVNNNPNFAFAFIMAYGPGKSAYEANWVNPGVWPIEGQFARWAFDMVEVYDGTSSVVDASVPRIKAVYVTPPLPDQLPVEGNIHLLALATDNAVCNHVTANGIQLVRTGLYTWEANIPGSGATTVNVTATDEAGNTSSTATQIGYTNPMMISRHSCVDQWGGIVLQPPLTPWCYKRPIKAYGTVSTIDANYFDLINPVGEAVRFYAPGHGLNDDDLAFASGIMEETIAPMPWITSHAALVEKVPTE